MDEEYVALLQRLESARMGRAGVADAVVFATVLHQGQFRNSADGAKLPYINHPLRVAVRLLDLGVCDSAVIVSAVLHDTVEDCSARFVEVYQGADSKELGEDECRRRLLVHIADVFGADVAAAVLAVSNPVESRAEKKRVRKLPEAERVEFMRVRYQEHVADAVAGNAIAFLVKLADWMDNSAGLEELAAGAVEEKDLVRPRRQALKYLGLAPVYLGAAHDFSKHVEDPDVFGVALVAEIQANEARLRKVIAGGE